MICDPRAPCEALASSLVSHIAGEVRDLCGPEGVLDSANMEDLARAVETFLEEKCPDGTVDSQTLIMLTSQALSSIGESQAARRLFIFGTGLVRPSEWEVSGGEAVWVLDLKAMTVRQDATIELIFFGALSIILESITDIWDASDGRGRLGLRHVCSAAEALLGGSGKRKQVTALASEILGLCDRKMKQLARDRGWDAIPRIMDLDI